MPSPCNREFLEFPPSGQQVCLPPHAGGSRAGNGKIRPLPVQPDMLHQHRLKRQYQSENARWHVDQQRKVVGKVTRRREAAQGEPPVRAIRGNRMGMARWPRNCTMVDPWAGSSLFLNPNV